MTASARQEPISLVLEKLSDGGFGPAKSGNSWQAHCPAHEDSSPSLSVAVGDDGRVLVNCHAGCAFPAIVEHLGLEPRDFFPPREEKPRKRPSFQERYGREVAAYDYVDEDGSLIFQAVRFERDDFGVVKKTFLQRTPDPSKPYGWNYKGARGVRRVPYRLPAVLAAISAGVTIYVVEGEKCADRLVREGLVATCNAGGAKKWTLAHAELLRGAKVVILPDNDPVGNEHGQLVASTLQGLAADVQVLDLSLAERGDDVVDWLDAGHTRAELQRLAEEAEVWAATDSPAARPAIDITVEEHDVVTQAIEALSRESSVFKRASRLVQVLSEEGRPDGIIRQPDTPRIAPLPLPRLRELLTATAEWWRLEKKIGDDDGERVRAHPPDWAIRAVDTRARWPRIRPLEAVTDAPVLRPDGTILDRAGYDDHTGIFYEPRLELAPFPPTPTREEALGARDAILDVVSDFPFASDVHRAAWVASLLTPLARFAFEGPSPLFLVDANVRAAGKSRLCDIVGLIVSGRPMARTVYPEDDDEMRKRITTIALSGDRLVLLDNLGGAFGHPSLDAALTATSWKDRILGKNEDTGALPLYATWFASGNNVRLRGDITRRIARIRLESPLENPERRSDFRRPDLLGWVSAERPRLLMAALSILRAYFVAGKPGIQLPPWGSYEGWSRVVRQTVVWIGLPDPGEAREDLEEEADPDKGALREVIAGWQEIDPDGRGLTVKEALKKLEDVPGDYERLRNAVEEIASFRGRGVDPKELGKWLSRCRKRVVGDKHIDRVGSAKGGVIRWAVMTKGGLGAFRGVDFLPYAGAGAHTRARAHEDPARTESNPSQGTQPTLDLDQSATSYSGFTEDPDEEEIV